MIHDLGDGSPLWSIEVHDGPVFAVAWSAGGERLATASMDRRVGIIAIDPPSDPAYGEHHRGAVYALVFLPGGQRLLSVGGDGRIVAWDANAVTPVATYPARDILVSISLSEDGTRTVVVSRRRFHGIRCRVGGRALVRPVPPASRCSTSVAGLPPTTSDISLRWNGSSRCSTKA